VDVLTRGARRGGNMGQRGARKKRGAPLGGGKRRGHPHCGNPPDMGPRPTPLRLDGEKLGGGRAPAANLRTGGGTFPSNSGGPKSRGGDETGGRGRDRLFGLPRSAGIRMGAGGGGGKPAPEGAFRGAQSGGIAGSSPGGAGRRHRAGGGGPMFTGGAVEGRPRGVQTVVLDTGRSFGGVKVYVLPPQGGSG